MSFYFRGPNMNPWVNPESAEARVIPVSGTHGAIVAHNTAVLQSVIGSAANMAALDPTFRLNGEHLRLEINVNLQPTVPPHDPDHGVQVAAFQNLARDLAKANIDIKHLIDAALIKARRQMEEALRMLSNPAELNLSEVTTSSPRGRSASRKNTNTSKKPSGQQKLRSHSEGAKKKSQPQSDKPAGAKKSSTRSPSKGRDEEAKFKPKKGFANFKTSTGDHFEYPTLAAETCCGVKPVECPKETPSSINAELQQHYSDMVAYYDAFITKYMGEYFGAEQEYTITNEDNSTEKVKGRAPIDEDKAENAVKVLQEAHDTLSGMNAPLQQAGATEIWQYIKHQLIKVNFLVGLAYRSRAVLKTQRRREKSQSRAQRKRDDKNQEEDAQNAESTTPKPPAAPHMCVVCAKKPCICE